MDTVALLIILAVAFGVSMWISMPFNQPKAAVIKLGITPRAVDGALEGEHQRLLDALQELDFDHAAGKLNEEDYAAQRLGLLQAGAAVLRQLDEGK